MASCYVLNTHDLYINVLPSNLILFNSMAYGDMYSKYLNFNLIDLIRACESDNNLQGFCKDIGILPEEVQCPSCESTISKLYCIRKNDY